jgi:hypothetical protein
VPMHHLGRNRVEWARQDSNLGPTDYESAALTAELRALRPKGSRLDLDTGDAGV